MRIQLPGCDTPKKEPNPLPSAQPPEDGAARAGGNVQSGSRQPVGVGELLVAGLLCRPLVAGKVSTPTPRVGERIPVVLKQKGQADAPAGRGLTESTPTVTETVSVPRRGRRRCHPVRPAAAAASSTEAAQKLKTE